MMRHWSLAIGLAALLLSACSASTMASRETEGDDTKEMKSRILELQRRAAVADVELERLRQEVARLDALLRRQHSDGVEGGSARGGPRPAEDSPHTASAAEQGLEEADLELQPAFPRSSAAASPGGSVPASEADRVGYRPVEPAAQALYDRGYTQFHQGRYLDAESTFQRFLQAYPDSELSDNAQYWIGECRFARGDLSGALAAFRETGQRYPEGNKVPDALLKEGVCLEGLGNSEGAGRRYEEVLRRFPGSAAAAIAEERRASTGR